MVSVALALILAILSPCIWGILNILDKFVVDKRVKSALGFAVIAGCVNLAIGLVLAVFLKWSGIAISDLLFPALAGMVLGSQFILYYKVLQKEDASNVIGFIYVYPIMVAFLSFLFLHEVLSLAVYLGASLIIIGVILLTVHGKKIKLHVAIWTLFALALVVALNEFFVKMATTELPVMNGVAINCIFIGLVIVPALLSRRIRSQFVSELHNAKWALLNETLTFINIVIIYFAMSGLPATIVSSIGAIQPLAVLFIEKILQIFGIRLTHNGSFASKILPLTLIVLGVIIIYSQELMGLLT